MIHDFPRLKLDTIVHTGYSVADTNMSTYYDTSHTRGFAVAQYFDSPTSCTDIQRPLKRENSSAAYNQRNPVSALPPFPLIQDSCNNQNPTTSEPKFPGVFSVTP